MFSPRGDRMLGPNETLERIRNLITVDTMERDNYQLACLVADLDDWLSRGGWLPEAWASDSEEVL